MNDVRRKTNDLIQAVEDGFLSWEEVARACLCYMSEDDVADMCRENDFAIAGDDELEDEINEEAKKSINEHERLYGADGLYAMGYEDEEDDFEF